MLGDLGDSENKATQRRQESSSASNPSVRRPRHRRDPSDPVPVGAKGTDQGISPRVVAVALPTGLLMTAAVALVAWGGGDDGVETFPAGSTPSPPAVSAQPTTDASGDGLTAEPGPTATLTSVAPAPAQRKAPARRVVKDRQPVDAAVAVPAPEKATALPPIELAVQPVAAKVAPPPPQPAVVRSQTPAPKAKPPAEPPKTPPAPSPASTAGEEHETDGAARPAQDRREAQRPADQDGVQDRRWQSDVNSSDRGRSQSEQDSSDRSWSQSDESSDGHGRPDTDHGYWEGGWSDGDQNQPDRGRRGWGQDSSDQERSDQDWSGSDWSDRGWSDSRHDSSNGGWSDSDQSHSDRGWSGSDRGHRGHG